MRVFHVISGFENGGVETLIYRWISHMPKDIEFHIVAQEIVVPACAERFRGRGVTLHLIPSRKHPFKHCKELLALFRTYRPDVVHVHTTEWGAIPLSVAKKAGVACRIQHSHAARKEKNPILRLAHAVSFAWARRAATDYFACGTAAAHTAFGKRAVAKGRVKIIKNGIDVAAFAYSEAMRTHTRKELGIGDDKTVIGMVARFSPQKNHIRALTIFKAFFEKHPNSVLLLVGDGHLRASTEELAKKILPPEAVRFLGVRTDMQALYSVMDRFILPSRFEGLPITLIEAQASGLSAVVADTVTREGDICGITTFLSTAKIAEWVSALWEPQKQAREAYAAQVTAAGYSLDKIVEELYQFYHSKA
ncbi:MAG: glycosyltransferase [Clostridia bacterium]|nr:glycosyltransferase [Clostridia bacterium]